MKAFRIIFIRLAVMIFAILVNFTVVIYMINVISNVGVFYEGGVSAPTLTITSTAQLVTEELNVQRFEEVYVFISNREVYTDNSVPEQYGLERDIFSGVNNIEEE